ncbi:MAG: TIGR02281 family clan AA aspartic protease [Gammaproteobacteria bacterium]|nr:TIGR02281 family clan AA aspartic protease [Gammaproteobacteria bacterium]
MDADVEAGSRVTRRFGRGMIVAAWLLVLALLTFIFQSYLERRENPNIDPDTRVGAAGVKEVILKRNPSGHYLAGGEINGSRVTFLLDTGATDVAVSEELADRLNLRKGAVRFSRTANGTVRSWTTVLDDVKLGTIRLKDVRASILPTMRAGEVLLGMSFLKQLELVQRGNVLTLKQY